MTQEHPITPSPELIQNWLSAPRYTAPPKDGTFVVQKCHSLSNSEIIALATQAARWGADQELDACCEWLEKNTRDHIAIEFLRAARRPKPPSLKEQALEQLKSLEVAFLASHGGNAKTESIRRALDALPD